MSFIIAITALLAASVEFIEALTIILAVGVVRGWRAALTGTVYAIAALVVIVAVLGPTLITVVPLNVLRLVIGGLLLLFGLKWLRKATLRYSGLKALHDEAESYDKEVQKLRSERDQRAGVVTAFNGVFLEGLEVVFIILGFGTTGAALDSAVLGAAIGAVLVLVLGLALKAPLTKIPENTMKYVIGIMLSSFGTLWAGEGLGVKWPLSDLFVVIIVAFYLAVSYSQIVGARRAIARQGVSA